MAKMILTGWEAKKAIKLWLETVFPNPEDSNWARHQRRVDKIDAI